MPSPLRIPAGTVFAHDGTRISFVEEVDDFVLRFVIEGTDDEFFVEAASNPVLLDYHPFLVTQEGDVRTSSPKRLFNPERSRAPVSSRLAPNTGAPMPTTSGSRSPRETQ